jgi:hypothetical protein
MVAGLWLRTMMSGAEPDFVESEDVEQTKRGWGHSLGGRRLFCPEWVRYLRRDHADDHGGRDHEHDPSS